MDPAPGAEQHHERIPFQVEDIEITLQSRKAELADVGAQLRQRLLECVQWDGDQTNALWETCLGELRELVKQHLGPAWDVRSFGSAANGFGTKDSDLDVTCCRKGGSIERGEQQTLLKELREACQQADRFQLVTEIQYARIPILKLRFQDCLDVDLSCNNVEPLPNTRLLRAYSTFGTTVRDVGVAVKLWGKAAGVCGAPLGHLSSYSLTLMAIYFLQVDSKVQLPCLDTALYKPGPESEDYASGPPPLPPWLCSMPLQELLLRFFHFFTWEFAWGVEVVSVRLGRRVLATEEQFKTLPGRWVRRLHVEDPYLLGINLNRVLGTEQEARLRVKMAEALQMMKDGKSPEGLVSAKPVPTKIHEVSTPSSSTERVPPAGLAGYVDYPQFYEDLDSGLALQLEMARATQKAQQQQQQQQQQLLTLQQLHLQWLREAKAPPAQQQPLQQQLQLQQLQQLLQQLSLQQQPLTPPPPPQQQPPSQQQTPQLQQQQALQTLHRLQEQKMQEQKMSLQKQQPTKLLDMEAKLAKELESSQLPGHSIWKEELARIRADDKVSGPIDVRRDGGAAEGNDRPSAAPGHWTSEASSLLASTLQADPGPFAKQRLPNGLPSSEDAGATRTTGSQLKMVPATRLAKVQMEATAPWAVGTDFDGEGLGIFAEGAPCPPPPGCEDKEIGELSEDEGAIGISNLANRWGLPHNADLSSMVPATSLGFWSGDEVGVTFEDAPETLNLVPHADHSRLPHPGAHVGLPQQTWQQLITASGRGDHGPARAGRFFGGQDELPGNKFWFKISV